MISKLSWILFVPFTAAAVFFKLAQTMLPDGSVLGLSDMMLDYAVIACVVVIFLLTLILCLVDRKISQYYIPHRNFPAGILGIILAVVLAADGANKAYVAFVSGGATPLDMVEIILLLLSAIVFIELGLTHSFSTRDSKRFALFNVIPALLCAVELVKCFIDFTTISITLADVTLLVTCVFTTLFLFNFAVAISLTKAKHAVKSCFIFGFPAAAALFSYGIAAICKGINTYDIFSNAGMAEIILTGMYIIAFLVELIVFTKDKAHVQVVGDEDYVNVEAEAETSETPVLTELDDPEEDYETEEIRPYMDTEDMNDYLYKPVEKTDEEVEENIATEAEQSNPDGYITNVVEPHTYTEEDQAAGTPRTEYDDTLDAIDKLILEISEDYDE